VARSFSKRWFDCEALETLAEAARYERFKGIHGTSAWIACPQRMLCLLR
ncbi:MAG: hypothetical protein ACJAT5_001115, partial [Lentimonas sp.]